MTIVLCGLETRRRKHVDWEIHATMYDSYKNPQGGFLVINAPGSRNQRLAAPGDKGLIPGAYRYRSYHEESWLDENFPDLPDRLFWNIQEGVPISIVNWSEIYGDQWKLQALINNAYKRGKTNRYLTDIPLRKRNSRPHLANTLVEQLIPKLR